MDLAYLIAHPHELNQETLYDLRRLVAIYPTYHAARILFLQNLFLLHDSTFDQELRRAALLVPDRRVLFDITHNVTKNAPTESIVSNINEGAKNGSSKITQPEVTASTVPAAPPVGKAENESTAKQKAPTKKYSAPDTTARLLDNFLDTTPQPLAKKRIKADPSTDYMAYLLQQNDEKPSETAAESTSSTSRLDDLIDSFIASSEEGITLSENPMIPEEFQEPDEAPATEEGENVEDVADVADIEDVEEEIDIEDVIEEEDDDADSIEEEEDTEAYTAPTQRETDGLTGSSGLSEQLAQIYIKQGKYERAMEIFNKISASDSAASNPYLADQMRFLQKLASINAKKNNKSK